jgi:hypothetical protein
MNILITIAVIFLIFRVVRYNQSYKRDLKEYIPYYKKRIDLARVEAENILREQRVQTGMGYGHKLHGLQKSILKKKYKIRWKTPAEMNKHIIFD